MISLQLQLFLLIAVGFLCKKIHILNNEAQKSMSDLLIYVILPCNILCGFTSGVEVSANLLSCCALALILSLGVQIATITGSKLVFRNWPRERASVASYGMIVSNSSFIGIPVMECLYGAVGVLYTAIYQIPIRFTMWSAGLALFTTVDRKTTIKKVLTHPCIVVCFIGFVMMINGWSFPGVLEDTITSISKCTSPVSMLVIGAILGDISPKKLLDVHTLYFSLLRLVILPMLTLVILKMLGIDQVLTGVSVLLTAMPAGSTTAILAQKYGGDAEYGAALVFVSTLLSIITLPIFSYFV